MIFISRYYRLVTLYVRYCTKITLTVVSHDTSRPCHSLILTCLPAFRNVRRYDTKSVQKARGLHYLVQYNRLGVLRLDAVVYYCCLHSAGFSAPAGPLLVFLLPPRRLGGGSSSSLSSDEHSSSSYKRVKNFSVCK